MPRKPSRRDIAEEDRRQLRQQHDFRVALMPLWPRSLASPKLKKIALFGSVARPLIREMPRFQPYRRLGIDVLHECKDVDLAVWLTRVDRLRNLGRARSQATSRLFDTVGLGVAHHQIDVFLFAVSDGRYLGRLCNFASCPKAKPECSVPGCGATAFLKQHKGFVLAADALDNAVILFDRRSGTHVMAVALPS